MRLVQPESGCIVAQDVRLADTFFGRLRGLMLTATFPEGSGLLLKPCRSIHTYLMNYEIDAVHVDEQMHVTGLERSLAPGRRGRRFPRTEAVIELPAGTIEQCGLQVGQALQLQRVIRQEPNI